MSTVNTPRSSGHMMLMSYPSAHSCLQINISCQRGKKKIKKSINPKECAFLSYLFLDHIIWSFQTAYSYFALLYSTVQISTKFIGSHCVSRFHRWHGAQMSKEVIFLFPLPFYFPSDTNTKCNSSFYCRTSIFIAQTLPWQNHSEKASNSAFD